MKNLKEKEKMFKLQILYLLSDEKEHKRQEIISTIINDFNNFTEEELKEKTENGNGKIHSAVDWAISHLKQEEYTINPNRGYHKISKKGKDFLIANNCNNKPNSSNSNIPKNKTPIEEENINNLLLSFLIKTSDEKFSKIINDLISHMNYETIQKINTTKSDDIISYVILEDPLGVHSTIIQALKLDKPTGIQQIRNFETIVKNNNANGVLITTSSFTGQAIKFAKQSNIKLIDGKQLTELMIKYKIGVIPQIKYNIDYEYFSKNEV